MAKPFDSVDRGKGRARKEREVLRREQRRVAATMRNQPSRFTHEMLAALEARSIGTGAFMDPIPHMGEFSMGPAGDAGAWGVRGRTQGKRKSHLQSRTLADKRHNRRVRQKRNLPFGKVHGAKLDFQYQQLMAMESESQAAELARHTRDVKVGLAEAKYQWGMNSNRPAEAHIVDMGENFGRRVAGKEKAGSAVIGMAGKGRAWYHADLLPGRAKNALTSPPMKRLGMTGVAGLGIAAVAGLGVMAWENPIAAGVGLGVLGGGSYAVYRGYNSGIFGKAKTWATEKGMPGGANLVKKIQDPATRADTIFDTASKGGRGLASGAEWIGGSKLGRLGKWTVGKAANNPRKMMAMLAVTAITGATVGTGVSGANQAMTMNRMHIQHSQQQRQGILDGAMPRDASKQVNPTFSGRRVKGGHMGATGDLVFAMNNRRKG